MRPAQPHKPHRVHPGAGHDRSRIHTAECAARLLAFAPRRDSGNRAQRARYYRPGLPELRPYSHTAATPSRTVSQASGCPTSTRCQLKTSARLRIDQAAQTLTCVLGHDPVQRPILLFVSRTHVRLTPAELNRLRQAAARNGHVVNRIDSPGELLQATLDALAPERQADLLEFLEKGSSPLTRGDAGCTSRS